MIRNVGIAIGLLILIALAMPAGAPVQISYVTSDSMSPTIDTDDGYVVVPAGTVEAGDIITFYSEERATYVTHRATRVTADGIVTKGDGNPTPDQASGYPLVQPSDVSGKLLTVGGDPVVIPFLGVALQTATNYWYLVVGMLAAYALTAGLRTERRRTRKHVLRSREIILPVMVVVIVAGVLFVSFGAVQQTEAYTVTEGSTAAPMTLPAGQSTTESIDLKTVNSPVAHVVVETEGMEIVNTSVEPPGEVGDKRTTEGAAGWLPWQPFEPAVRTITVRIPAQETVGPHATAVRIHPYPAVLPGPVITRLHGIHPLVAAVTTVLTSILPLYLIYRVLIDSAAPLRRGRSRLSRRFGGDQ
jgi:signal peptidase